MAPLAPGRRWTHRDRPALSARDSAIAALALLGAPSSRAAADRALLYLSSVPEEAAELRALRALALAAGGHDTAALLDSLPTFLNGGGLGAVPGHQSNHHDTAWWIRALAVEEDARLLQIVGLVDHLTAHAYAALSTLALSRRRLLALGLGQPSWHYHRVAFPCGLA